jgi:uncharacterized membrane protein YgdD (TMEM256/DUF423 family)
MKRWLLVGAANGFLAVLAGAFAAHLLQDRVDASGLAVFQTAANYQLLHALAIIAASFAAQQAPAAGRANLAAWLFTLGIVLFCGSLYFTVLARSNAVVLLTPLGGISLLAGWIALATAAFA